MGNWAHETRKQIVIEMIREDPKLGRFLKAFLKYLLIIAFMKIVLLKGLLGQNDLHGRAARKLLCLS